jgi:hypothetical protein
MGSNRIARFVVLACAGAFVLPPLTLGQSQDPQLAANVEQALPQNVPVFRDPRTGAVWSPDEADQDDSPSERGFVPGGQSVLPGPPIELNPGIRLIGRVPIVTSASGALLEIDNPSIQTVPEGHWYVVFYLQNNSDSAFATEVACIFGNGDRTIARAVVFVPSVESGTRVAVYFTGPISTIFLDAMTCRVSSP